MTRRLATYLYVFAGWTVFVWAVFIRNISRDHTHGTAFKVVHIGLAVISLLLAAGTFWLVSRAGVRPVSRGEDDLSGTGRVPPRKG
jgi:hypothetical protein